MTSDDNLKVSVDELKNRLVEYEPHEMRRARDTLDARPVHDRCYHKLRSIDARFGVCRGVRVFLDLCGGPGQFAKYVFDVSRDCKGYGVTLRNANDYRFAHRNFRKIYGCFGTGDLFDPNVLFELMYFCRHQCDLVIADGAFDVTGRENDQETLTLSLLRKETDIALETLRVGGDCVLKIFDTFNRSTISLLQSFVNHFAEHHLYKPRYSRAANAEKYLVCKGRLAAPVHRPLNASTRKFARKQKAALKRLLGTLQNERA
ncbi:ac69-like protein [Peridroma alphabaculovirus]|uniref:Ac69-like protein n=1 Tax=Peridroma alphabaculovirus TaxID=1346829 RepID=A0A068LMM7_9ABAC|nr:ac69-like protein [Peridroma alphabaculovirus]AIE47791.1 ac69-like protein [Peridroma alphabaculovirus]